LLQHKADVRAATRLGTLALQSAQSNGHDGVVRMLHAAGSPDAISDYSIEAVAARSKACRSIDLNSHMQRPPTLTTRWMSELPLAFCPLSAPRDMFEAAACGDCDTLRLLMDTKGEPAIQDIFGTTPLHRAAAHGEIHSARLLVEAKALVNARLHDSLETPLHEAAKRGLTMTVKLLLDAKAQVNATASIGTSWKRLGATPLHAAALEGHEATCRLLVGSNANVAATENHGLTAAEIARQLKHYDLAMWLDAQVRVSYLNSCLKHRGIRVTITQHELPTRDVSSFLGSTHLSTVQNTSGPSAVATTAPGLGPTPAGTTTAGLPAFLWEARLQERLAAAEYVCAKELEAVGVEEVLGRGVEDRSLWDLFTAALQLKPAALLRAEGARRAWLERGGPLQPE